MRSTLQPTPLLVYIVALSLADACPIYGSANAKQKESHLVVVDVVVIDGENRPVKGLGQQDFQIFENKKDQQIRSFEAHEQQTDDARVDSFSLPHNTFSNASASDTGTINVVLLDQMNTFREDQMLAQKELIAYLKQKPPGSRFALFAYRKGDSPCLSCDALRMLQGITDDKKLLIGALKDRAAQPEDAIVRRGTPYEDTSMYALAEIGNFLQDLPGRKQLLWLSDNFDASPVADRGDIWFPAKFRGWQGVDPLSQEQTLHLAASRLAVARVAVYPIDLNGRNKTVEITRLCNDFAWYWYLRFPTQGQEDASDEVCKNKGIKLDSMAEQSGGQASHDRGIRDAIARAVSEGKNYYTLSYIPTTENSDGKVRTIRVAINRQGYQLQYLQHYFADDPSTLFRPDTETSPDIVLPGVPGGPPWRLGQVSHGEPSQPPEPIMAGLRYGGPAWKGVIFEVHFTPNGRPKAATPEQMATLKSYESFRDESAQQEMWHLTEQEQDSQHKGKTTLTSLPSPGQVYLQEFSMDFSIAASQIKLMAAENGSQTASLEIAVVGFDERGKKVVGMKETVALTIPSPELQEFETSGYHTRETINIAERAVTLRIAVRDVSNDRIGSTEIPIWAIVNRHKRRRLEIPESN